MPRSADGDSGQGGDIGPGDVLRPMPPSTDPEGKGGTVMLSPSLQQESAFLVVGAQRAIHLPRTDHLLFSSRDHKEAVAAYRERRPPIFEGC